MATKEELAELNAAKAPAGALAPALAGPEAIWRSANFPTVSAAVDFANVQPVQQTGEFGVSDNPNGDGVTGYYFF